LDTFAAHQGSLRVSTAVLATVNPVTVPMFRGIVTTPPAGGEQLFDTLATSEFIRRFL
jgi:hypothetical protein